jgi:hypothetical protein
VNPPGEGSAHDSHDQFSNFGGLQRLGNVLSLASFDPAHVTQQQLESALWTAANALRGPVDPGDFKSYVFPVMFFKWVSDNWDHNHQDAGFEAR